MSIDDISNWLNAHQLLVVSVGIPIISAVVAGASSWYSTRKALKIESKKMNLEGALKTAEFRQNWINTLRDAMAEFQSYGVHPDSNPAQERLFYELGTKIELMMNPDDPDYSDLQKLMYRFLSASEGEVIDKYASNAEFVELCQKILKREWDRLKTDIQDSSSE